MNQKTYPSLSYNIGIQTRIKFFEGRKLTYKIVDIPFLKDVLTLTYQELIPTYNIYNNDFNHNADSINLGLTNKAGSIVFKQSSSKQNKFSDFVKFSIVELFNRDLSDTNPIFDNFHLTNEFDFTVINREGESVDVLRNISISDKKIIVNQQANDLNVLFGFSFR